MRSFGTGFRVAVLGLGLGGLLASCAAPPPPAVGPSPRLSASAYAAKLGVNADLTGLQIFPKSNPWNTRIDKSKVDKNSKKLIKGIKGKLHADFGADWDGGPFGIPYVVVSGSQAKVPVKFYWADESDKGPYPIPTNAPIEGGAKSDGDRHVLVLDRDNKLLYEIGNAYPKDGGAWWQTGAGAKFNLNSNKLRPKGWTSADAAGLPILPGLVRYDEVASGKITHAIRFTVAKTRKAYISPARHYASNSRSSSLPPMGMRVRLKKSFKISSYPKQARVILQAMKTYGLILADNGSNWYVSGTADDRWNDAALNTLKKVPGSAFEVVKMGKMTKG
ncbi:MAG: hypothetical protein L6256_13315 [Propionicimonas sp.]|uniref:hypothetical protein n=1 Tax=Propionicimonas sp. TaxID=1955623 RepID=UPI001D81863F|nr:hypothetical protein [Propionicimonas sp.]MBU4188188.1 hypothetical protein [Actinomycetota bacterium]MBU4206580.1 hypothetical protein [Actinomycetota bacterium]MBU4250314.1 hypothetical protein [Actinomycetota bacterium]MBU4365152.1 hypothetical protein [Actinomycetota bacterium]MBU4408758.1 hypothetical protein [Actinomycetota bacterium]